jgi:hypothetical protein
MDPPRLLLIPSFTELEWGIRPQLDEWAEVAAFDMPGVGPTSLPTDIAIDSSRAVESLSRWREEGVVRALEEIDRQRWKRFVVATDGYGTPTAIRLVRVGRESVLGLAIGHASLSHSTEGDRAPVRRRLGGPRTAVAPGKRGLRPLWDRADDAWRNQRGSRRADARALPRHGVGDSDGGGARPGRRADREDLEALDVALLLAKHEGCLGRTDEGSEDIVAAFPNAATVICPEACTSSPAFAEALKEFWGELA